MKLVREVRKVEVVIECLTRAVKRKRSKEDARGQTVHGGGRTRKIDARVNEPPRGGGANLPSSSKRGHILITS